MEGRARAKYGGWEAQRLVGSARGCTLCKGASYRNAGADATDCGTGMRVVVVGVGLGPVRRGRLGAVRLPCVIAAVSVTWEACCVAPRRRLQSQ